MTVTDRGYEIEELKPCPLCGCENVHIDIWWWKESTISCARCCMCVQTRREGTASAINILNDLAENWNKRVSS